MSLSFLPISAAKFKRLTDFSVGCVVTSRTTNFDIPDLSASSAAHKISLELPMLIVIRRPGLTQLIIPSGKSWSLNQFGRIQIIGPLIFVAIQSAQVRREALWLNY